MRSWPAISTSTRSRRLSALEILKPGYPSARCLPTSYWTHPTLPTMMNSSTLSVYLTRRRYSTRRFSWQCTLRLQWNRSMALLLDHLPPFWRTKKLKTIWSRTRPGLTLWLRSAMSYQHSKLTQFSAWERVNLKILIRNAPAVLKLQVKFNRFPRETTPLASILTHTGPRKQVRDLTNLKRK